MTLEDNIIKTIVLTELQHIIQQTYEWQRQSNGGIRDHFIKANEEYQSVHKELTGRKYRIQSK